MREEEDCEVAVQGVCMLPEGAGMKGAGGIHFNLAPHHQPCLNKQTMCPCQHLHLQQTVLLSQLLLLLVLLLASLSLLL